MSMVNFTGNVGEFIITGFDHVPYKKLLGTVILITYFLILLGNSTNICIILTDRRLHRPMYILIVNLAVVDLVYTTGVCITMISILLADIKTITYYSCITQMFNYQVGNLTVYLALPLMAMDRIVAISCPLRYGVILSNPRIIALILLSWCITCSINGAVTGWIDTLSYCQPIIRYVFCDCPGVLRAACDVDPTFFFRSAAIGAIPLILLFVLIMFSYLKIIYTVVKLKGSKGKGSSAQMFNTCVSHVIVVLCFYAPKFVSSFLTRAGVRLTLTERNALLIVATLVPPLINPAVYCLKTKEIRARLVQILSKNIVAVVK